MRRLITFLGFALPLLLVASVLAQSVEISLKDGSRWRGQIGDTVEVLYKQHNVQVTLTGLLKKAEPLYIIVEGKVAGALKQSTIFRSDIVSMKTVAAADPNAAPISNGGSSPDKKDNATKPKSAPGDQKIGVFVLPMVGPVGETFRHEEIEAVAKEADKYGPGQIIVLDIASGGGSAIEMEIIHYTIKEIKKRHRVVAWIKEAISAAAATAANCDEIYFRTTGTLGAMTMFAGGVSVKGELLRKWMDLGGKVMETGGNSKYIAWAMIDDEALLSYDKDPVTGRVTWYNDLSGQYKLSDEKSNLTFTATTAVHSGFADGIADTHEQLAQLLNIPEWHEISDYGRRIAAQWQRTVEQAKIEIPKLAQRMNYKGSGSGDPNVVIGSQIQIINELKRWWDRCPNVCRNSGVPSKEELERFEVELRRQLTR